MKKILLLLLVALCSSYLIKAQIQQTPDSVSVTFTAVLSGIDENAAPPDINTYIDYTSKTSIFNSNVKGLFVFRNTNLGTLPTDIVRVNIDYVTTGGLILVIFHSRDGKQFPYPIYNNKTSVHNGTNTIRFEVKDGLIWITSSFTTTTTTTHVNVPTNAYSGEGGLWLLDMNLFKNENYQSIVTELTPHTYYSTTFSGSRQLSNVPDEEYYEYDYDDDNTSQPSQLGNALNFDGSNDNVSITNTITANFTLETWIKTSANSLTGTNAFQGNGLLWSDVGGVANDFTLAVLNNKISFFDGSKNGGITGSKIINDGLWHHVAVTRQAGGSIIIYVDGVQDATTTAGTAILKANPSIKIGGNTLDSKYFSGSMDEIRIWNVVKSQEDIQDNMANQLFGDETGLVAYYNCNQGVACSTNTGIATLPDITTGVNNGTLNNFSLAGTTSNWVPGVTPSSTLSLCVSASTDMNNNVAGGVWSTSNANIVAVTSNGKITAIAAGTATINYTVTNANGCVSVSSTIVTVNALPIVSISGATSFCAGNTASLTTSTGASYKWSNGATTQSITVSTAGTYSVIVTNASGCVTTASKIITENALPSADFSGLSYFPYAAYEFKATVQNSNYSYQWYYDYAKAYSQTANYLLYSFNLNGSPNFYWKVGLYVKDNSTGCSNSRNISSSGGSHFHVQDLPIANASATTVCQGSQVTLSTPQVENYYYVWSTNADGTGAVGFGTSITVNPTATTTYYLTAVDENGHTTVGGGTTITVNALPIVAKNTGNGLSFDGSDDYVAVPTNSNIPIGNSNYSIEAWIKPTIHTSNGIVGWGNWGTTNQTTALRLGDNYTVRNGWYNTELSVPSGNLADGNWHHVAATFDGTTRKIYVDGVLKGQDNPVGHNVPNASNLKIGRIGTEALGNVQNFQGNLDEVRIWNIARTQAQVQAAMNSELVGTEAGLVSYYNCNQGIANGTNSGIATLTDKTSNANNGTLTNFGLSGTTSNWVAGATVSLPLTNGLSFDGSNDFVAFTNNPPFTNGATTIESWINTTSTSTTGSNIVTWANTATQYSIEFRVINSKLQFGIWDGTSWQNVISKTSVNTGTWVHVAAVADGSVVGLYINGVLDTASIITNTITPNAFNIGISSITGSPQINLFVGQMDELRIWNVARTQAQIQTAMNTELLGNETGLKAYYNFNQGIAGGINTSVTIITDKTANAYNGTLTNFALNGYTSNWVSGYVSGTTAIRICSGNSIQLNNATTGGAWSSTSGAATVNSTGLVTGISDGTAIINYMVTNANGCTTTASTTITVNATTTVTGNQIAKNSICTGETVTILNGVAGGTWSSSNSAIVDVSTYNSVRGVSAGTATVTYTLTNASGCTSSASTVITVNNLSMSSFNGATGNKVAISNTGVIWRIGTDGFVYRWIGSWSQRYKNLSAISLAVDNNGTPWIIGSDGKIYFYFYYNSAWYAINSTTGYKKIASGNGKTIVIAADNSIYQLNLTSSPFSGNPNPVYGTLAMAQPTYSVTQIYNNGQYYPTDIAVGSTGTVWFLDQYKNMNYIDANNVRQIAGCNCSYGTRISCGQDGSVFITGTDSKVYQYNVATNDWLYKAAFGLANNDFAVYESYAIVTINNSALSISGCFQPNTNNADEPAVSTIVTETIDQVAATSTIRIFPNPAHDKVTVQLAAGMEKATVTIICTLGTTIATDNNTGLQRVINLFGKPSGTYLVRVTTKDGVSTTQKLMIQ